jgi:glyoxylase-like metal-dependent hydrolase (beta-lactamase superfamily II)
MAKTPVITLDLNFQGTPHAIASYLIRHSGGAVLIESGPGSCLGTMQTSLADQGLTARDITHVLLTHIHLDHAGAAGWFARQGAEIIVHPVGAPHMVSPEKLLASARRIYGDQMDRLWGEFLAVPESSIRVVQDAEEIVIGPLRFLPVNTPGHAEHHYAYIFEDLCFTGDIGGVRIPGQRYLRLPMPPPELNLERWHESISRLRKLQFSRIAPTHFGIYDDTGWQLDQLDRALVASDRWLQNTMSRELPAEEFRQVFKEWAEADGRASGLSENALHTYEIVNPSWMSADGLKRYWMKVRQAQ